jgi:NAD(P)-dependent dehydrogenase (short-subunit alcohol dehydrogenase family)
VRPLSFARDSTPFPLPRQAVLATSGELTTSARYHPAVTEALVTGCNSGIGLATAVRLAEGGAHVFATVHHSAGAESLERARDDGGLPITVLQLDVTDEESIARALASVATTTDCLDVLVNNAGRVVIAPVEEIDDDIARAVFDSNFFGALRLIRAVLPPMRRQGSGMIVNVSSMSARLPAPFYGLYAATKQALEAVSEALRVELAPFGIHVLVVEPGNFRTSILDHALHAPSFTEKSPYWSFHDRMMNGARQFYDQFPDAARVGDPREVADAIDDVIHLADPPFRLPVGSDAAAMQQIAPEDFSALVRGWLEVAVDS